MSRLVTTRGPSSPTSWAARVEQTITPTQSTSSGPKRSSIMPTSSHRNQMVRGTASVVSARGAA